MLIARLERWPRSLDGALEPAATSGGAGVATTVGGASARARRDAGATPRTSSSAAKPGDGSGPWIQSYR